MVATAIGALIVNNKLTLSYSSSALAPLVSVGPAPGLAALMASNILNTVIAGGKDLTDQERREFLEHFSQKDNNSSS
jgi:hypothetical protein